ncbi:hypothetical protein [Pseudarthrobacter sp. BIM B-2242]|uniref:hypothetical protein n=1 Tax=Pseudarthrobacter sp. BIM B-2242 TaxID=2772401 RepID=UPI00168B478B|nr:hypothetical protein [Pseudarthrobacter sp. BIM B-2242]QOD05669.1 hypothetical protein IDT60_21745 [Pseudarthrobacter sp. BIM B-2242]
MRITMPVKDWLLIDATIDNTVAIAAQNGEAATAAHGNAIRESGWEASRSHAKAGQGPVGWPPEDEELSLDLTAESWHFVVEQLRRWDNVDDLMSPRSEGDAESRKQVLARKLEERVS